jgi:predicted nucleic acid-binding Zn ribbon protein
MRNLPPLVPLDEVKVMRRSRSLARLEQRRSRSGRAIASGLLALVVVIVLSPSLLFKGLRKFWRIRE